MGTRVWGWRVGSHRNIGSTRQWLRLPPPPSPLTNAAAAFMLGTHIHTSTLVEMDGIAMAPRVQKQTKKTLAKLALLMALGTAGTRRVELLPFVVVWCFFCCFKWTQNYTQRHRYYSDLSSGR